MSEDTMDPGEEETTEFDELLTRIPEMDHQITDLQGAVKELLAELANYPAGGPWLWEALEPAAQRELWAELEAFVVWLQNRILCHHASRERWIPPCWYKHPDAVEQLTALMVAHKASYHPKAKTPSHTLVDWFQKCLWPTMDTLRERLTLKECQTERRHVEPYMPGERLVANGDAFTAFVDATVPDPETGEIIDPPEPEAEPAHG